MIRPKSGSDNSIARESPEIHPTATIMAPPGWRHLAVAGLVIVTIMALKVFAAHHWQYGPADVDRFAVSGFGYQLDRDVPPPFLLWSRADGQAFFTLAADPMVEGPAGSLPPSAAFRYNRIGYSLLVRLVSLSQLTLIPYALTAVGLLAMGWIAFIASRLADVWGPRMLLLVANPGVVQSAIADGSEPLGMATLLTALTYPTIGAAIVSSLLLGISRPSFATVLPAAQRWRITVAATAVAVVLLQIWIKFVLRLGGTPAAGNLTYPLGGYIEVFGDIAVLDAMTVGLVASMAGFLVFRATRGRFSVPYRVACLATGLAVLSLSATVVNSGLNIVRVSSALFVLLIMPPESLGSTPRRTDKEHRQR